MDRQQREDRRANVVIALVIVLVVTVVFGLMIWGAINGPRLD